jgi:HD-like signal output (HDOD) protein
VANSVTDILRQIERIEPFPQVAIRILELSLNDADSDEISAVVQEDPGLTGKVLKLTNSAMCGLAVYVESIDHAIRLISPSGVASLTMTTGLSSYFMGYGDSTKRSNEALWMESLHTALFARLIARKVMPREQVELAYTVGLLQNIGHVVFDRFLDREMETILSRRDDGIDPLHSERDVLGMDHARCAMLIGRRWGLSERLLQAILYHHNPSNAAAEDTLLCQVVNVAEGMTWGRCARKAMSLTCPPSPDSAELMNSLNPDLDAMAEEVRLAIEASRADLV